MLGSQRLAALGVLPPMIGLQNVLEFRMHYLEHALEAGHKHTASYLAMSRNDDMCVELVKGGIMRWSSPNK